MYLFNISHSGPYRLPKPLPFSKLSVNKYIKKSCFKTLTIRFLVNRRGMPEILIDSVSQQLRRDQSHGTDEHDANFHSILTHQIETHPLSPYSFDQQTFDSVRLEKEIYRMLEEK